LYNTTIIAFSLSIHAALAAADDISLRNPLFARIKNGHSGHYPAKSTGRAAPVFILLWIFCFPGIPCLLDLLLRGGIVKAVQLDLFTPIRQLLIDAEKGLQPLLLNFGRSLMVLMSS
jgi:hypothetical protein